MLKSNARPVFDEAERAKGDLDPLLVVPEDVVFDHFNELLNGDAPHIPRIEHFVLEAIKEPVVGCVVR